MATFEELFPDSPLAAPFEPIVPENLGPTLNRTRRAALDLTGSPATDNTFEKVFGLSAPSTAPPEAQTEWGDFGKSVASGVGQMGVALAGAGEYAANKAGGTGQTPGQQMALDVADTFRGGRLASQQFSQDWFSRMTPEAQARAEREILTLDPNKTIWQGSPKEFLSSVALKMAQSAPSSLATLGVGALMMRAGMGGGALAYLGASEGGLSLGSIASNIAQEIEAAPESELLQSPQYTELRRTMDEPQARQAFIPIAQGYTPVVGGLLVGAISYAAGRYLEPVMVDKASGFANRFARGYASEAMQEGPQSGAEQMAQNIAAQTFDSNRSVWQGVPEQAAQGAAIGGPMGGSIAALAGAGARQALPVPEGDGISGPSGPLAPRTPESFERVFEKYQPRQPRDPTWRGSDVENQNLPDIDSSGQRLLNVGPVDPAIQAALNARQENKITDLFEPQPITPQQEQQAYVQKPFPYEQQDLGLTEQSTAMVPSNRSSQFRPPVQQPLLEERARGQGRVPLQPMAAQPLNEDMSAPASVSMERSATNTMPVGQRPTRADFMRARAEQDRAGRYAGTMQDPSQVDLFGSPESLAPPQIIEQLRSNLQEVSQLTQDPKIIALGQQLNPQMTRAAVAQVYQQLGAISGVNEAPEGFSTREKDQPSAEPLGDLIAQLEDLRDPDTERLGVYLAPANIQELRQNGTLQQVLGAGMPLANFDGKGGVLIAKNRDIADELISMRDRDAGSMQEILGMATGAGAGKPAGADIAVQQRDEKGNVVRESLVATPEEADSLASVFDETPGREGVILSAGMVIKRRAIRLREEARQAQAQKEGKQTRRGAGKIIEQELGDTPLAESAGKKISKSLSENEAARKLVDYGTRLRKQELKKHVGRIAQPEVLEFKDEKTTEAYKTLFGQYRDAEIAERMAATAEDHARAKTWRVSTGRQIEAFRRLNKATTQSEKIVGVARKISQEEVQKIERAARETAVETAADETTLDAATADRVAKITPEQLNEMPVAELNLLFTQAAEYFAGRRKAGRTFEQLVADYPTPSERKKLILRMQQATKRRMYGGGVKATPITGTTSSIKTAEGAVAVRKRGLSTRILTVEAPSRELSKFELQAHNKRVRQTYSDLVKSMTKADKVSAKLNSPEFKEISQQREDNGNPPQNARDIIYGRAYLRTLFEYARSLQQAYNRSPTALREIERLNKIIGDIAATSNAELPNKLAALFRAESREQTSEAARTDPKRLGMLRDPKQRLEQTQKQLRKLREHIAWHARLDNEWHTNGHFNSSVGPLMRKFSDAVATYGWPNYRPTLQEMQSLRFALRLFRVKESTRASLFKPVRRWFADLGFKFKGQDLLVNPKEFETVRGEPRLPLPDQALLAQARRRFGTMTDAQGLVFNETKREAYTPQTVNTILAQQKESAARVYSNDQPLNEPQLQKFSKTEEVNRAIGSLRKVAERSNSTTLDIINAEQRFLDQLRSMELLKQVGVGGQLYRVLSDGRYGGEITFRPVGPQLRKGALTNAEARSAILDLYKPIPMTEFVRKSVANRAEENFGRTKQTVQRDYSKAERDRRAGLSIEQRKALSALDRQDKLNLELHDLTNEASKPAIRAAAARVASTLEANALTPLTKVLQQASAAMPENNAFQAVIKRLIDLNMSDALVTWDHTGRLVGDNNVAHFDDNQVDSTGRQRRVIRLNRARLESLRAEGYEPSSILMHGLVHESVHAATIGALENNPRAKAAIWALMRQARTAAKQQGINLELKSGIETYGFRDSDVREFVAEAFSNQRFQGLLRSIKVEPQQSLWQVFLRIVQNLLGMESMPEVTNILDAVLATSDKLFTGELRSLTQGSQLVSNLELDPSIRDKVGNVFDKAMQSNRVTQSVRKRATDIIEKNKEGGSRFILSALTMEQMRDFYAKSFGDSGGPLNEYMKAFFKRNADNSANMEVADKLSREWTALTEQDAERAVETSRIMAESTLYGIHPDHALNAAGNEHVKSITQQQRHSDLAKRFRALPPEWKKLYGNVQKYYDQSLRKEVALMTLNALRATLPEGEFKHTESDIEGKKFNTQAGLEKEFGDKLTASERQVIARLASIPQMREGPYFPLMRFGDYVVTAERVRDKKTFGDIQSARDYASAQRESDPTLSVTPPSDQDGAYTVTVTEKEVQMAESPSEAEQTRKHMIQQYGADHVSQVQLKSQLYNKGATISSNSALGTILGKLDGNPAAQAAIKDFYLRTLADGAFRKREIKRANRRGVDYDLQHRTFASYAKSAAYYTSQLKFGWQMADHLIGMDKYVQETARGEHESDISAIRMGEVVREIDTRDKLTTDHVEVSKIVRKGTALSQFMMLTSPSYWMINSTQPYMVTLPWLAARSSVGDATAALLNAQKMIASPIINQMGESWLGAKALWSKASAEKAFTVLEQVEEHIKQRGGTRANEYITMLNNLKRESIIDLSFVAELRDIAEGQNASLSQKVLDASRIMSHLTEVNNRIMTAIAAYDLYRNKNASPFEAESFAKQAVSLTQFNYSSGNAPRLFQSRGPLGQMGPLVFQFMKYPQHIYALLIDNMRRAVATKSIDRDIARKTLLGLFTTHLAAGGVMGAMLQPIKWAIGLTMAAFGDDDEPYTLTNAMSGETFDRLTREITAELFGTEAGEILSAGLPRAVGVDVSNRMSLGTLYFIDLKTDTSESTLGSLATAFGGPLVSLASGFMRGAEYINEGQFAKGMESFLPKGAKDIFKTIRYSSQGLTDASGKEIIGAKDMSPWQLFVQSLGFQPAQVSEKYAQRAAEQDALQHDQGRKQVLVRRFVNARTPEDRHQVIIEIAAFNKANPAVGITRSQLIKNLQSGKESAARTKKYGSNLQGKQRAYVEYGEPYNVDDEETAEEEE